jgi:hypothetical protein
MTRHPYRVRIPGYDPERQLLAAVVLEAVRDLTARRKVSDQDRASARAFLGGPGCGCSAFRTAKCEISSRTAMKLEVEAR